MFQPARISTSTQSSASKPQFHNLPLEQTRWLPGLLIPILLIFLEISAAAGLEKNFYQIINDSQIAVDESFITDRGYSVYVNYDGQRFLYDVGHKKKSFLGNMDAAGIGLDELDFVVLSHRHPDHTRGWSFLRKEQPTLPIYAPPGGGFSHISELSVVNDGVNIGQNIYIIRTHDDLGSASVTDELSILIKTRKGPYFFTTNSHTDFFMRLEKAKQVAGQDIYFHSGHVARRISPNDRIETMAKKMKALNIKMISPSHSSPPHNAIFEKIFGTSYVPAIVGKKVLLEPLPK